MGAGRQLGREARIWVIRNLTSLKIVLKKRRVIFLTASAAAQLNVLVAEKGLDPGTAGLRLAVEKGGCAGMQYIMEISPSEAEDQVIERDGARLFVAGESLEWLEGCEIDYEDGLSGAGFRVRNPRATRNCGCGTSFEPAAPPAA